jgi:hypothetical protein
MTRFHAKHRCAPLLRAGTLRRALPGALLLVSLAIAACGGGGSGSSDDVSQPIQFPYADMGKLTTDGTPVSGNATLGWDAYRVGGEAGQTYTFTLGYNNTSANIQLFSNLKGEGEMTPALFAYSVTPTATVIFAPPLTRDYFVAVQGEYVLSATLGGAALSNYPTLSALSVPSATIASGAPLDVDVTVALGDQSGVTVNGTLTTDEGAAYNETGGLAYGGSYDTTFTGVAAGSGASTVWVPTLGETRMSTPRTVPLGLVLAGNSRTSQYKPHRFRPDSTTLLLQQTDDASNTTYAGDSGLARLAITLTTPAAITCEPGLSGTPSSSVSVPSAGTPFTAGVSFGGGGTANVSVEMWNIATVSFYYLNQGSGSSASASSQASVSVTPGNPLFYVSGWPFLLETSILGSTCGGLYTAREHVDDVTNFNGASPDASHLANYYGQRYEWVGGKVHNYGGGTMVPVQAMTPP